MDFKNISEKYILEIDAALKDYLKPNYPEAIYKAMGYSCQSGGKRLRPTLLLAACCAVGGEKKKAMPFACALEMIHTYSLIHDDLPAMDNDDLRRGRPTNHIVFGENMAILAGDALLNMAYEIMIKSCNEICEISTLKAMEIVANSAGVSGMIGGQVMDVLSEDKEIDRDILLYIHKNKTAALIKAAFVAGAILGGGSSEQIELFEKAGKKMGLAFQIKDDILDITSSNEVLGKTVGSDKKNNKATYVSIFGKEKAMDDYLKLSQEVIDILKIVGDDFIVQYGEMLVNRIK